MCHAILRHVRRTTQYHITCYKVQVCMFYLGPFSIKGVQYTQCDMILNMWTKARTWKSYDCF